MRSMVELLSRSPTEHEHSSGPRISIEGVMPAQGFTAVNGMDRRQPPSPLRTSQERMTESRPNIASVATAGQSAIEGAQPSAQPSSRNDSVLNTEPVMKQSPDTSTRKRLISDAPEGPYRSRSRSDEALSPKRRLTDSGTIVHSHTSNGPTLSLLNTRVSIEASNRDTCSRERSPVPTRNQRVAPAQVRPETAAHLAESLATHLQDAYKHGPVNDGPNPPVLGPFNDSPAEAFSPEDTGDAPGKRKRVFSNRTKSGCHTCRGRKKKCDEAKPVCNNCARGGFDCTGYGPKPLGYKGPSAASRAHIPLQSKVQDASRQPSAPQSDGPRYDHWGRVPPTPTTQEHQHNHYPGQSSHDGRRPHSRGFLQSSPHPYRASDPYSSSALPPVEYPHTMPPDPYYAPRPPHEHWAYPTHSSHNSISGHVSSRESISTHSSRNPPFTHLTSSEVSEKHKMMIGEPYKAHIDDALIKDRKFCKIAVDRWNRAHDPLQATSDDEKARLFQAILDPFQRRDLDYQYREELAAYAQSGSIGSRVIINHPIQIDYGYNTHIADDVFIGANCILEDHCDIYIGKRSHVGRNVLFCGSVISDDPASRQGSMSSLSGGAIIVEDDVNIGAGTIIMPHRVIGKGASVAAGSVVTKNIPAYTIAAGNPCRVIKSIPRPESPETKRRSRELTTFTNVSSGSRNSEQDDLVGDKQLALENEQSLREMRLRRGYRDQRK